MTQSQGSTSEQEDDTNYEQAQQLTKTANELLENIDELTEEETEEVFNKASSLFDQALEFDPEYIEAFLGKGYVLGLQERFDEGKEILLLANSLDPEDKRIQEMLVELEKMKIESIQEESKEEEEEEDGKEEVEEEEIKENTSDQTSEKLNQPTTELPATTIPYLVENGVMTESFYKVLLTIFNHFDQSSKDGAWSPKELENFFITVNGVPPDNATKLAIKQQFKTNTKGWLLLEGFFELYLSQTAGDPQETWKDLKKLGFDELLKPIPQMGIFSN